MEEREKGKGERKEPSSSAKIRAIRGRTETIGETLLGKSWHFWKNAMSREVGNLERRAAGEMLFKFVKFVAKIKGNHKGCPYV